MRRCLFAGLVVLLTAAGCTDNAAETTAMPGSVVVGSLALGFSPWQEGAVVPPELRSVSFVLLSDGVELLRELRDPDRDIVNVVDDEVVAGELDEQPDWESAILYFDFEIALEPGEYELVSLEVNDPGWSSDPVSLLTGSPKFTVADSGCTYIGLLNFNFYRLPPGSIDEQERMAGAVAASTGVEYFTLLETGSFFGDSIDLGVPSADLRPESAAECTVHGAEVP